MALKTNIYNGSPSPLGCSVQDGKYNFAVFSQHAEKLFLGIFQPGEKTPLQEYPLICTNFIWHIALSGLPSSFTYAFRAEGILDGTLLYNKDISLADPYAKKIDSSPIWNQKGSCVHAFPHQESPFDWQGTSPPNIKESDLIIYEMHVRGFTKHPSSGTKNKGTYLGVIEKIPYLKKLGVNAVELMPIFEFDETHSKNVNPQTKEPLPNYWGYNPLHFFVPMRRYAESDPITEWKTLVREMHRNGIAVLLDVVYNHTGEGKEKDYYVHFRGLDNPIYYQVKETGEYRDTTGCGHTVNANHPAVQTLIIDSLRYWANDMRVDGFRFDLCAALIRGLDGKPMENSPLIEKIEKDPLLSKKILIAEAWDASGLYLLGDFSKRGHWKEWNGWYRDHVRRFLKGTDNQAGSFAAALSGSEPIYGSSKTPFSSINFITSHDGYSLRDLVSYQQKHNLANGEQNKDGSDHNDSWNCGAEGATEDEAIRELRERQMRNFLLTLFFSQGIPMLLMGDEYGHTRGGNNNPYAQDNEINWFLWDQSRADIVDFTRAIIALRKKHSDFFSERFLTTKDISWHGHEPSYPDWSEQSRFVAFSRKKLYLAFNAHYQEAHVKLPPSPWNLLIDTSRFWNDQPLTSQTITLISHITMAPYSAILCVSS